MAIYWSLFKKIFSTLFKTHTHTCMHMHAYTHKKLINEERKMRQKENSGKDIIGTRNESIKLSLLF